MESYIVRIYRREKTDPSQLAGQVEDVSDGGMHPFTSTDHLGKIFAYKTAAASGGRGCRDDDPASAKEPP